MSTRLLATLEKVIDDWAEEQCSEDDWPDAYWYEELYEDMAKAAFAVFEANVKGQKYATEEGD